MDTIVKYKNLKLFRDSKVSFELLFLPYDIREEKKKKKSGFLWTTVKGRQYGDSLIISLLGLPVYLVSILLYV